MSRKESFRCLQQAQIWKGSAPSMTEDILKIAPDLKQGLYRWLRCHVPIQFPTFALFYCLLTGFLSEASLKQEKLSQGKAGSTLSTGHLKPRVLQALAGDAAPQDPELCHRTVQPHLHQHLAGSRAHPIRNAPKPPQKKKKK